MSSGQTISTRTLLALNLFSILYLPPASTNNALHGQSILETVVIDVKEDLVIPGWSMGKNCVYNRNIPDYHCNTNVTVDKDYSGVGFWSACGGMTCEIIYERQPGETILEVELVTHQKETANCNSPGLGSAVNVFVELDGSFQTHVYRRDSNRLDFRELLSVDRIQTLKIWPDVGHSCRDGFYQLDKIIVHKSRVPRIRTVDTEKDVVSEGWITRGSCLYQFNFTDFSCKGEPPFIVDDGYVGSGFWMACEEYCQFDYKKLPEETLEKIQIGAMYNNAGLFIRVCQQDYFCIAFSLEDVGSPQLIDFRDYFKKPVYTIEVTLPTKDYYTGTNVMLDQLTIYRTLN